MAAETEETKKRFFRKHSCERWTATLMVGIYAVWCSLLVILTASGVFLDSQNFECRDTNENFVASRLKSEANLVYLWSGLSLPSCALMLVELWRKKGHYKITAVCMIIFLSVVMISTLILLGKEEAQDIQELMSRYHGLFPLWNPTNRFTGTGCDELHNVYRWQAEFKCCGLRGYKDWTPSIPDSCLCSVQDNSTGCVRVGDSLVYKKPCLPIVVLLAKTRSRSFWAVMIFWVNYVGFPISLFALMVVGSFFFLLYLETSACYYNKLSSWIYKKKGGVEMVPVVFIRKNKNSQSEEENSKNVEAGEKIVNENVVLDVEDGQTVEEEAQETIDDDWNNKRLMWIPLSEFTKLQEELDPPPSQHQVRCLCLITERKSKFYTVLIDEGSPLLPAGAELVDPDKPTHITLAIRGHLYSVEDIVWPQLRTSRINQPL
ncbi:uncharacterized protein LOC121505265 [Xyrichtys novacula]|uniref:Uncharacterized protein LOC121505265 n=1 Tax=Xyrichtys novacula TaxID=13765 RepID=A0AAV1F1P0_XYRNO|nr:uncharacterized protein LOC121505265 [Xyrichtys novacula]